MIILIIEGKMDFINREKELDALERAYRNPGFQFIPLYGRRRIGKTRLVREFLRDKRSVYFHADSASEKEQLKNLGRTVGTFTRDSILTDAGFRDWHQFFDYLKAKLEGRVVFVIDEFPYLANANPAISSIFQKGIDDVLGQSDVFLILMGSSIGMMEKEILFYKAPLYGRRTGSLEIPDLRFGSLKGFFPGKKFEERIQFYSVFGTVPAYLEKCSPEKDVFGNIEALILDTGTFLYDEVEYLLREELREPRNYFVILRALSQGKRKLSEIINETGFEKSLVARYLDILQKLNLVKKDIPVTEKNPEKSKRGLYRIRDKYIAFWFKYVFPNRSYLELGEAGRVLALIRNTFEDHAAASYEEVCLDIGREIASENLPALSDFGRWWTRTEEIDIVAIARSANDILFGECKWSQKKVGEDVYQGLKRKANYVDWKNEKRIPRYALFSRSGFTDGMLQTAERENVFLVHGETLLKN